MPNSRPPRTTGPRGSAPATVPARPSPATSDEPSAPADRSAGIPAAWAEAASLLATAMPSQTSTVAPINTALLGAATGDTGRVDLSGLWTEPADPAAPRSSMVLRRLDDKGRLTVPIEPSADLRLPAERVGAVLTLFLPGSGEAPAPGRVVANVPLRTKGRITLPAPIRDHLGLPPSADVLVMFDPERHVLRICAASRLEASVAAGLDSLASSGHSTAPPVGNTGPEQLRALPRPA